MLSNHQKFTLLATMVQSVPEPESYVLRSTTYVPNNMFPVLVYRSVLPQPIDEKTTTDLLEQNEYERKGLWTGTPVHHFHPNTHECYAVISGFSIMHVGRGQLDHLAAGQQLTVKAGDVVVMPAGTAHMNVSMSDDYLFVGVYPKVLFMH